MQDKKQSLGEDFLSIAAYFTSVPEGSDDGDSSMTSKPVRELVASNAEHAGR